MLQIDGCYDFHVKADEMELGFRQHSSYGTLEIEANVTEDGTGLFTYYIFYMLMLVYSSCFTNSSIHCEVGDFIVMKIKDKN